MHKPLPNCFQFWQNPERSLLEIDRVLRPQGRIVIVFRDHSSRSPDWLPNPMSRSGREVEVAMSLLAKHGYIPTEQPAAGSSRIIRADRGDRSAYHHCRSAKCQTKFASA
jgi:SAM-dependent methyltransferase